MNMQAILAQLKAEGGDQMMSTMRVGENGGGGWRH